MTIEFLDIGFFEKAFIVGILSSIACGIIGTFVVVNRMVFISGSISHSAFGGIGIAYYLGVNPFYGAIIFSVLSGLGIGIISKKTRTRIDTLIGVIWAMGMAIGIIFMNLKPGYSNELMSYLFGNILIVPNIEIVLIFILNIIIVIIVSMFFQHFKLISFDYEYAKVIGINSFSYYLILILLISLTVVILIRVVGIILVIALLTIPASIANYFTNKISVMMLLSSLIGIFFISLGLLISKFLAFPPGALVIILLGLSFLLTLLIDRLKK